MNGTTIQLPNSGKHTFTNQFFLVQRVKIFLNHRISKVGKKVLYKVFDLKDYLVRNYKSQVLRSHSGLRTAEGELKSHLGAI